jgi:hypothetical protein
MFLRNIFEALARTGEGKAAVVGWGRGMGHKGHMYLASSVITHATQLGADPYFVVSRTVGKDDPITPDEKLAIYKKVFPQQGHIFQTATDEIPDLTRVLSDLNRQGYTSAIIVLGADQVKAFQYLKNYNGKPDKAGNVPYTFDKLDVISRQETSDPSAGEEGPRATPMRAVLMDPTKSEQEQFQVWRDAMNPQVSDDEVRDLMMKAKERMTAMNAPKPKKAKAEPVNELSSNKLGQYKKAAGAQASAADKAGDIKKADKRFSGIVKATKKQFANDEKVEELSLFKTKDTKQTNKPKPTPGEMRKYFQSQDTPLTKPGVDMFKKREIHVRHTDETKKKGADGKACWDGYRYNGTKNGKDSCVKVSEGVEDIMDALINKIIVNEAVQNNRK